MSELSIILARRFITNPVDVLSNRFSDEHCLKRGMPIIHGDGLLCDAWQILSQRGWRSGYRHWLTDGAGGFETRMSARHELNLGGGAPLALAHHHLLRLLLP